MKNLQFFRMVPVFVAIALSCYTPGIANAQLRISFAGANGVPLDTFDETVDEEVTFNVEALRGSLVDGVEWHLTYRASSHAVNGFPTFPNTVGWFECGSYPGTGGFYVIPELWTTGVNNWGADWGGVTDVTDDSKTIEGNEWRGLAPNEYQYIRVMFASPPVLLPGGPVQGTGCVRYFWIPIRWTSGPVTVDSSTWGRVKGMYR